MMNTLDLRLRGKKKGPDPSYFLEGPPLSTGGSVDQELQLIGCNRVNALIASELPPWAPRAKASMSCWGSRYRPGVLPGRGNTLAQ